MLGRGKINPAEFKISEPMEGRKLVDPYLLHAKTLKAIHPEGVWSEANHPGGVWSEANVPFFAHFGGYKDWFLDAEEVRGKVHLCEVVTTLLTLVQTAACITWRDQKTHLNKFRIKWCWRGHDPRYMAEASANFLKNHIHPRPQKKKKKFLLK